MAIRYKKDPDEVLDFQFNWENWLESDTISTSTFAVESGLTKDSDTNTTTTATVWLSGGTDCTEYEVMNEIVTAGGRTAQRTIRISVEER